MWRCHYLTIPLSHVGLVGIYISFSQSCWTELTNIEVAERTWYRVFFMLKFIIGIMATYYLFECFREQKYRAIIQNIDRTKLPIRTRPQHNTRKLQFLQNDNIKIIVLISNLRTCCRLLYLLLGFLIHVIVTNQRSSCWKIDFRWSKQVSFKYSPCVTFEMNST